MVSPACLKRVRGLGGAGISTGAGMATGAERVFITTGSLGAAMRRARFLGSGFVSGMGSGSKTTGSTGVTGSSRMTILFRGALSSDPLGRPRSFLSKGFSEFSPFLGDCSELSGNSSEFSGASAIYYRQ